MKPMMVGKDKDISSSSSNQRKVKDCRFEDGMLSSGIKIS